MTNESHRLTGQRRGSVAVVCCLRCSTIAGPNEYHRAFFIVFLCAFLQGTAALVDPNTSWVGKWLHHRKHVPGCYALSVNVEPPPHILEIMEENGVVFHRDS